MTLKYEAESLADVAKMLDMLAGRQAELVRIARTQKDRVIARGSELAYRDAAEIVRNTTLEISFRARCVEIVESEMAVLRGAGKAEAARSVYFVGERIKAMES